MEGVRLKPSPGARGTLSPLLSPPSHRSFYYPRPAMVSFRVFVAKPMVAGGGGAVPATPAHAAGPVQTTRQRRAARLHDGQAALLVGQGQKAAVTVTLCEMKGN